MSEDIKNLEEGEVKLEIVRRRWKNRRRMAYISLYSILTSIVWILILATYATIVGKELAALASLSTILSTLYVCLSSIIGAYVGFSTWEDSRG